MMSQCVVPNWNLSHQRQEQGEASAAGDDDDQHRNTNSNSHRSSSPHVHSDHNLTYVVPMDNYEVAELTWENGQLALHGLGGIQTKQQTTSSWEKPGDHTLESIVHQATFPSFHHNHVKNSMNPKWGINSAPQMHIDPNPNQNPNPSPAGKWRVNSGQETSKGSMAASSAGKLRGSIGEDLGFGTNKRVRSEPERVVMMSGFNAEDRTTVAAASASASATFCRDTADTAMMTWNSFESPGSLKSGGNGGGGDDDSTCQISNSENMDGDQRINKGESLRRRSRAAAIHNQSERRRRDRINEKMRALQKLVPNASKTDKASMLDEVIEYLKQLQAQVQMMSTARNMPMPQMVMQQQQQQIQQQMSLLAARMGMGLGMGMGVPGLPMGMLDVNTLARNVPHSLPPLIPGGTPTSSFVSPPFAMPSIVPNQLKPNAGDPQASFNDAYASFFAQQSMNMDFFNKMAAMYRQQPSHQTSKKPVTLSHPNNGQA